MCIFGQLFVVIGADSFGGKLKRSAFFAANLGAVLCDLIFRKPHLISRKSQTVEFFSQTQDSFITVCTHLRNNLGHNILHIRTVFALCPQKRCKCGFKVRIVCVQKNGHAVLR